MIELRRAAFVSACMLDVAVRKPGNVSVASPGHGMAAAQFVDSARAAAGPLFEPGARVGDRIERAVAASFGAAGCNTNLGIVLLCAPLAAAAEGVTAAAASPAAWRGAIAGVLETLDVDDARAAYRGIAMARPGGLGAVPVEDVRGLPSIGLREAMRLAAGRDTIARQYTNGFVDLFDTGLQALRSGFVPVLRDTDGETGTPWAQAVHRVYLAFLASLPDAHIVRKHGEGVAHNVMCTAQEWLGREGLDADPAFAAWDAGLKAGGINPGTSADLTVATLWLHALLDNADAAWHGS